MSHAAPRTPDSEIQVEGVGKTFRGKVRALDAVSFSVSEGDLVALIGSNGSGKSTLLKILFGILAADEGEAWVFGRHPRQDKRALRAEAGFARQQATLDAEMTGWETLRLFYALRGLPHRDRRRRLAQLVEDYGLASFCNRRVREYSGGQRQRLHLALAVMHAPRLLLLDEPTASLDPEGRHVFWRRLLGWREAGRTALVATHDLSYVAAHCNRLLLLKEGRLLAAEPPAALIAAHSRARAVITLAEATDQTDALRRELGALGGVLDVTIEDRTVTLWRTSHLAPGEPALDVLAARGLAFSGYERLEADLAGAYFRLTGSPWTPEPPSHPGRGRQP